VVEVGGRISEMFEGLKGRRPALIAYATGYYPDVKRSRKVVEAMIESGADAVEVGLPYSDPVMDGPVIQETSRLALESGATTGGVLELVSTLRDGTDRPLIIMSYYNPVFRYGLERFASDAVTSGVDGVVIPDLPVEEMGPWKEACDRARLETVAFCSLTTDDVRIRKASDMSSGFLYCVALLGTTGPRESTNPELPSFLERVRRNSSCPIAAGVGISSPEQCARVGELADGVIVGSALMSRVMEEAGETNRLGEFVRSLKDAIEGRVTE
jgi:tryptophan synthase alpha chain